MQPKVGDIWYRYEVHRVSNGSDEYGDTLGYTSKVQVREFKVDKVTKKGVWLNRSWEGRRFVLLKSRKRYACATEMEAFRSFLARKKKQIRILRASLFEVKYAVKEARYEHKRRRGYNQAVPMLRQVRI